MIGARRVAVLILAALCATGNGVAHSGIALNGLVADASSAAVSGLNMFASDAALGFELANQSAPAGDFAFDSRPGVFFVSAALTDLETAGTTVDLGAGPPATAELLPVTAQLSHSAVVSGSRLAPETSSTAQSDSTCG